MRINNERDLHNHICYCWFNPVKHGHVQNVEDWPYSTFHRDHQGAPKPRDFERALNEHASANRNTRFGERE